MVRWQDPGWIVAVLVVATTVASGAAFAGDHRSAPAAFGGGTATASVERLPADEVRIDPGRFGTDVPYLRIPDVTMHVTDVSGRPRVVYDVRVPALDAKAVSTRPLADRGPGRLEVRGVDHALDPGAVSQDRYGATVRVRVQSFDAVTTAASTNTTVEVER